MIRDRRFLDGRDIQDPMARIDDVMGEVADIYRSAVGTVGPAYYGAEQVAAWARAADKPTVLGQVMASGLALLRTVNGRPAALGQVSHGGHIGLLYVHGAFTRQGHGAQLLVQLTDHARRQGAVALTIDASYFSARLAARHGFIVEAEERPDYAGVRFTRWRMRLTL
ncbi:GNAT family N-acetyltransferase [Rhodovibrio salinarum]|nr:GNAT family N-acetyltransferase [Rhodovibrio salinarum]